jgi:hypothetical protein
MTTITDEFMRQMLSKTKRYSIVILKATQKRNEPGVEKIIWEHGRRNFALRADGLLSIVCPVSDGTNVAGVAIFNATVEKTREIILFIISLPFLAIDFSLLSGQVSSHSGLNVITCQNVEKNNNLAKAQCN